MAKQKRELDAPIYEATGPRILALDPGLKHTGYVLLRGERILTHGIWNLGNGGGFPPRKKILEHFELLLNELSPKELVLEWPAPVERRKRGTQSRTLRSLFGLAEAIQEAGKGRAIPTFHYDPNTIRRVVVGDGWATKDQVAFYLTLRYPELRLYLKQDRKWKEIHFRHMFDALAAGICHLELRGGFSTKKAA